MTGAGTTARDRLLAAAVDHVAAHGIGDLSLRRIGAAIGSSHRMLLYHFDSRDGLLVEIVREVEQRQRDAFAGELTRTAGDPIATARAMWHRLSAPALAPNERLFFELYGRALGGDPGAAPLLEGIIDAWIDPLVGEVRFSRAELRLGIAVVRGLLLDLLATGDREATTEAFEAYLAHHE